MRLSKKVGSIASKPAERPSDDDLLGVIKSNMIVAHPKMENSSKVKQYSKVDIASETLALIVIGPLLVASWMYCLLTGKNP